MILGYQYVVRSTVKYNGELLAEAISSVMQSWRYCAQSQAVNALNLSILYPLFKITRNTVFTLSRKRNMILQ